MENGSIRILIAEDDADGRSQLVWLLESCGYCVRAVGNAHDAISEIKKEPFDILLTDIRMPGMNGMDLAAWVKHQGTDTDVIIMTAYASIETAVRAVRMGAFDYLIKPFGHIDLVSATVEQAVKKRWLEAELEQARLALSNSFSRFSSIVEVSADGILIVDSGGIIRFTNPSATVLLDKTLKELLDSSFGLPLVGDETVELDIVRPGGDPGVSEMRVQATEWEGRPAHLVILHDITDRKRAEELRERLVHADRLVAIGQLAAGVAHEINNPAAYVMANLAVMRSEFVNLENAVASLREIISTESDPARKTAIESLIESNRIDSLLPEFKEILGDNLHGMERIRSVVKDMKSFCRLDREDIEFLDLNDLVEAAANMVFNEIRHRARLTKDLGRIPLIAAHRGKLTQVITNLLVNAAHAISEGAADRNQIRVVTSAENGTVVVSVEDTGCGIAEGIRVQIFKPFFTTKPREQGTGLGLSMCADIVHQHGGEILCASTVGEGSQFKVVLPLDTGLTVPEPKVTSTAPAQPTRRARILVIDDEVNLLSAYSRSLRKHEVIVAAGGAEGIEILNRDTDFDVIICDLMMPNIDGPAVYEDLRKRNPKILDRLVFCSGGAFTKRAKNFIESVDNLLIEKPIEAKFLLGIIDKIVCASSTK